MRDSMRHDILKALKARQARARAQSKAQSSMAGLLAYAVEGISPSDSELLLWANLQPDRHGPTLTGHAVLCDCSVCFAWRAGWPENS